MRKRGRALLNDSWPRASSVVMKHLIVILPVAALAACTEPMMTGAPDPGTVPSGAAITPTAPPPPTNASSVEDFDTTTEEQRQAAVAAPAEAGARELGTTIASLGSPTDPGIWMKTPLVSAVTQGRVEYNGKSVNVELRPSGGAAGSGSQISLAAMRLLEAPLTGLPEVTVFAR